MGTSISKLGIKPMVNHPANEARTGIQFGLPGQFNVGNFANLISADITEQGNLACCGGKIAGHVVTNNDWSAQQGSWLANAWPAENQEACIIGKIS